MSKDYQQLEEGTELRLDFEKLNKVAATGHSVLPVVVQDVASKEVLLVGYVNREALDYALENKVATMWSTSRNELWIKGATSGEFLDLVETRVNCEQNSLLYLVKVRGKGACHTNEANGDPRFGCYYRQITTDSKLKMVAD
jgi:phosphoribosyl-AMP cyclohydrolase